MSSFLTRSPYQTFVIASVVIFVFLNIFLPLNFSSLEAEKTQYPFRLTVELEKSTYNLEEQVNVTWILTNIGEENVTLYNSIDYPFDFVVYDENYNYVFRFRQYVAVPMMVYAIAHIAPNDSLTLTGVWKQIYDSIAGSQNRADFMNAMPGIYYFSGFFESRTYNLTLQTPPIRIVIVG